MLKVQRKQIDAIDKQIVKLFEERMQVAHEVARIKKEANVPIFDAVREKQVIEKVIGYLENDALQPYLKELYTVLMNVSKDYQKQYEGKEKR